MKKLLLGSLLSILLLTQSSLAQEIYEVSYKNKVWQCIAKGIKYRPGKYQKTKFVTFMSLKRKFQKQYERTGSLSSYNKMQRNDLKSRKGLIACKSLLKKLRFDFTGAVGLVLSDSNRSKTVTKPKTIKTTRQANSNLDLVTNNGDIAPAIETGSAIIKEFLIAPNNKLYILLESRTPLTIDENDFCILAEVDLTSGLPICIEKTLSISWLEDPANNSIQFDSNGAIYYLGRTNEGNTALKRFLNGQSVDLINQNINIKDFLVLNDGHVIINGSTRSSNTWWLRKINPTGGIQTISNINACNQGVTFMKIFPDGKIYIGVNDCNLDGVYRMLQEASSFEDIPWFSWPNLYPATGEPEPIAHNCSLDLLVNQEDYTRCGVEVESLYTTASGDVFGVAQIGYNNLRSTIIQYYDNFAMPLLMIKDVKSFQPVANYVILAGLDKNGRNIMALYNTSENSEIELIGPDNEIEIYNINFVASENKIMFDGLRFSDNKYVIGQVDLNTMQVTSSQVGSSKLIDFKTF